MTADELIALNPFPGLRSFAPADADLFFGREEQIAELLRVVDANPFVAVSGPSGCGKSSIVLAGLIQALQRRTRELGRCVIHPVLMRPGRQPCARLAGALAPVLGQAGSPEEVGALYGRLRLSAVGLIEAVRLSALPQGEQVVIVVDQFEEIFRYERISDPQEAAAFVKLLLHAAHDPGTSLRVILTLRSDSLGLCADFPGLAEAVSHALVLVPKLSRDQRKQAIVGPVQRRGFEIRPSLVQRILNDVPNDYDDLPVMQHALSRTWAYWAAHSAGGDSPAGSRALEVADYEAVGGSLKALDRHGRELLDRLAPPLQRVTAAVMRALTERRPDGTEVRRPMALDELRAVVGCASEQDEAAVASVVEHFRHPRACFLTLPPGEPPDRNLPVDITHESLIRQWAALRDWVDVEARSRARLDTLLRAVQVEADLWQDRQLKEALQWQREQAPNEPWVRLCAGAAGALLWPKATQFLADSEAAEQARVQRRKLGRWAMAVAALVLLGTAGMAAVSMFSAGKAKQQRDSQELANRAWHELRLDPALSASMALGALGLDATNAQAEQVLRQSAEALLISHTQHIFEFGVAIADARISSGGKRIAVVGGDQLALIDAASAVEVAPRRKLPWRARSAWLLDAPGLVVLHAEQDQGLQVQNGNGEALLDWNCPGSPQGDSVSAVHVSADGHWLAAGCFLGQIALWRLPDAAGPLGAPQLLAAGKGATVTALAFDKQGRMLASGDSWGYALVWKLQSSATPWIGDVKGKEHHSPLRHDAAIRDLELWGSDEEQFLASASDDGTAIVWKLEKMAAARSAARGKKADATEKRQFTLKHDRPVTRVRIDSTFNLLTVADSRLQFWVSETPKPADARHNTWITDVDVSPSGLLAASSSDDGITRIWSRERGSLATLIGHRDRVSRTQFIDENHVMTASADGNLRIWQIDPAVFTLHATPNKWMLTAAPSPDGSHLALCGEKAFSSRPCALLALVGDAQKQPLPLPLAIDLPVLGEERVDYVAGLHWNADGSSFAVTSDRYDIRAGNSKNRLAFEWSRGPPSALILSPRSPVIAQHPSRAERVRIDDKGVLSVENEAGADVGPLAQFQVPGAPYGVAAALSGDGRWVATTDDKTVWLFDREAPAAPPRRLEGHEGTVMALDISPDSRLLASAGSDRKVKLWSLEAGAVNVPPEVAGGHSGTIFKVLFSHDGRQIYTAGADGTVRVWSARSGRELATLEWHSAAVNDLRLHPTEDVLFTASDDGSIKRGRCRTCGLDLRALRDVIDKQHLIQLTRRDQNYLAGGKVKTSLHF